MSANANNIARRIAPLFGFSTEMMLECMTALQQGKSDAFYEELAFLEEENIGGPLAEGGFGVVMAHKTDESRAFKLTYHNPCLIMGMMEAFIQAVLCTEPIIGASICKLFRVYQSPKGLVLEIEKLPITLEDYIEQLKKQEGYHQMLVKFHTTIKKEIYGVIRTLQGRFKFQHNDLSFRNIMIKDNHIKLIDFAFSRITIDGKLYSLERNKRANPGLNSTYIAKQIDAYIPHDPEELTWDGGKRRRQIKRRTTRPKKHRSTTRRRR